MTQDAEAGIDRGDEELDALELEEAAGLASGDDDPDGGEADGADAEGTTDDDSGTDDGEGAEDQEKVKGLTPEAQKALDARIGKEVGKRKVLEAELADAKAKLSDAEARLEISPKALSAALQKGLFPEYVTKPEAELLKKVQDLAAWRRWARLHANDEETVLNGKTYTRAEVNERLLDVEEELEELAPQARRLLDGRLAEIRRHAELGRKLAKRQPKTTGKPAPKPPVTGGAAGGKPATRTAQRRTTGMSNEEFSRRGGNRAALESMYADLL